MGDGLFEDGVEGGAGGVSECDGYFDCCVNVSVEFVRNWSFFGDGNGRHTPSQVQLNLRSMAMVFW